MLCAPGAAHIGVLHNENQPRTADGRFGTVSQSKSDVELTAAAQLSEWQVLELARPDGKTHTVRATNPEAAWSIVLNDVGTKRRQGSTPHPCQGKSPACEQTEQLGNGKEPESELEGRQLEFTMAAPDCEVGGKCRLEVALRGGGRVLEWLMFGSSS